MARVIQGFKNFEEAEQAELEMALRKTPQERILFLHKLIHAWMKFPKQVAESNNTPTLNRMSK
jgi:hypothetical protein